MNRPVPRLIVLLGVVGALFVILPIIGLVDRVPWNRLGSLLADPVVLDALGLSLISSLGATAVVLVVGIPLAWLLARASFPGRGLLRAVVTLPMVMPPVVGGAALLFAFGRSGLVGAPLDTATGIVLPYSLWAVVMANSFIALPFLVLTIEAGFRSLDSRYEGVAATLGAGRWTVIRRVTLPLIGPSLATGAVLAWARALGEFGATVTFAGNLGGTTQTMPLAVFVALESDRDAAVALSLILVVISLAVLVLLRDRWWGAR